MTDYEKHLQQRGLKEYTLDGAINPAKWAASTVRVLFYLKENYGYQECGIINIIDHAHKWLDDRIPTYVKSVPLAAAIEIGLQRNLPLSQDEIDSISTNYELLHATLDKMAVVNIKKHSGKSISDGVEIREESHMNSSLLRAQIKELSPTVIVAGGAVCWDSLIDDIGLFHNIPACEKFEAVVCDGTVLCYSNHPAARRMGEFDVNILHRAILAASHHHA